MKRITIILILILAASITIAQTPNLDKNRYDPMTHLVGLDPQIVLAELNKCKKSKILDVGIDDNVRWVKWFDKSTNITYTISYLATLDLVFSQSEESAHSNLNNLIGVLSKSLVADEDRYWMWRDYTFRMFNPRTGRIESMPLVYDLYDTNEDDEPSTYLVIHWDVLDED